MYITCKIPTANLKLIDNLIVSLDTSTLPMASSTDLTTELGSFWIEAATDCVLSVTGGMVSNVDTRILIIEP
jgi:hypothetical protein